MVCIAVRVGHLTVLLQRIIDFITVTGLNWDAGEDFITVTGLNWDAMEDFDCFSDGVYCDQLGRSYKLSYLTNSIKFVQNFSIHDTIQLQKIKH